MERAPDIGQLNSHPLVHGILIAALEQQKRLEHGVTSMRGLRMSELELSRMSEAGVMLSAAACNKHLLKQFGLAWAVPSVPLHSMHEKGLPEPFLAMAFKDVLETNSSLIFDMLDHQKDQEEKMNPRRFCLAFDKTYLIKGLDIVAIRAGKGYVGPSFDVASMEQEPPKGSQEVSGFLPLVDDQHPRACGWDRPGATEDLEDEENEEVGPWDASKVDLATEVCEFLTWCPSLKGMPKMSSCCIPLNYEVTKIDMLKLLGHVLLKGGQHVRTVVFDNQSNHNFVKAFMLGRPGVVSKEVFQHLPFWNQLTFKRFPESCLPNWPFSRPYIDDDALFFGCVFRLWNVFFLPDTSGYIFRYEVFLSTVFLDAFRIGEPI